MGSVDDDAPCYWVTPMFHADFLKPFAKSSSNKLVLLLFAPMPELLNAHVFESSRQRATCLRICEASAAIARLH